MKSLTLLDEVKEEVTDKDAIFQIKEIIREKVLRNLVEQVINRQKDFDITKFNEDTIKMLSCKMAVKANTNITIEEMEGIINDLRKCKNPYNCPHGRPSIIHFSIYELEKMFHRSI